MVLGVENLEASYFRVEQYSVQGVKSKDKRESAFPSREDRVKM